MVAVDAKGSVGAEERGRKSLSRRSGMRLRSVVDNSCRVIAVSVLLTLLILGNGTYQELSACRRT